MKSTVFCQWLAVGTLSIGGLSQTLFAEGPADLEALAEKAKQAAEDTTKAAQGAVEETVKEAKEAVVEEVEEKKEEVAEMVEEVADEAEAKIEQIEQPVPVDLEKRAEKLGLLSHLSPNVSAVLTLNNGERLWGEVTESGLGGILLETLAENEVDLTDPDSPGAQLGALFKEEFLLAVGEGTPKQLENLLSVNDLSDTYQTALMVRLWTAGLADGGMFADSNPFSYIVAAIEENPDFLVNLVAASQMPPILIAARISDDGQRDEFAAALEMGQGMALGFGQEEMPFLSSTETEVAGIAFSGLKIAGKSLMETLQEEMDLAEKLENFLDPASAQDVINSLSEKNLVLLGGASDEAIYLYLGDNEKELPLVAEAGDGLTATKQFSFADPYLNETLVSVLWMEDELVEAGTIGQDIFGNYIRGIRLGLEDNDALGNTKQLEKNLDRLEQLEKKYVATGASQAAAAVSFLKADGLHTEGFGGYIDGLYDWETAHEMGSVSGDSFFTVQSVDNAETVKISTAYLEALFETVYEMVGLMSELEEVPADFDDFLDGFLLFDEKMKGDALALWQGLRKTDAGLGTESIFEIDLAGSWPTVPGVPQPVIDNGLAPRLSYLAPVTDRAKLAESWVEMNAAVTELLKTASEMAGEEIPMQKPMSSENNGLKTWFFPIPMQTDDFVPSVTLDGEVMVMSTSKERAVTLAQAAKKAGKGETGVITQMNFAPLQAFLANWLQLVQENPEMLPEDEMVEFLETNQDRIQEVIAALDELDSWRTHTRMEEGQLRTSSHFKTK